MTCRSFVANAKSPDGPGEGHIATFMGRVSAQPHCLSGASAPASASRKAGIRMRPSLLNPLFAAITTLPGVGPRLEKLYRHLFGREQPARVIDLLFHLPTGAIDRRARPKLS